MRPLALMRDGNPDLTAPVFPGPRRALPMSNMVMLMLLRRMKRDDLTAHGFRSTFSDWAAERTGYPREVVEMALAHAVENKVEAAYRRGDLFDKRRQLAPGLCALRRPLWNMALIASRLHLVWIATVCGKLKTDFRYSNNLRWNTFPIPALTEKNRADLTRCAEDILLAREAHFPATIADLYDPENMPANLREAHERNDEVLERIYIGRRFRNDTERLEKLFELYTRMTAGQRPAASGRSRRRGADDGVHDSRIP